MPDTDQTTKLLCDNAELQKRIEELEASLREQEQIRETLEKRIFEIAQPPEDVQNICFDSLFNLDDIQRLQNEFSDATGVASIITYPDGTPITAPSNFCRLCNTVIRKTEKGLANCIKSDATLGRFHPNGPIIQPCLSSGLWDAGTSIMVGGKHIANWLIGQVRDETQTEEKMRAYAREIGADEQVFMEALYEVPAMPSKKFEQIAKVLFTLASQLSATAYQNVQKSRFITKRKQAEAERKRLMAAIEQTEEIIFITDPEGTIQYTNPAFERVTGYQRNEVLGKTPRILKSGMQNEAFYTTMWQTLTSGKTWGGRFNNKRKDGSIYTEEAMISPVRDPSGTIVNYVAVKRDITRELETEQQLLQAQKMESVGRLAGGIAHDFNNMLMVILSYADLCRDKLPREHPVHKWLNEITNAGQHSVDITSKLLAFARRQTISPLVLDLNDTVSSMLKLLRRLIGENIELAWLPGANLWRVKLDPSQIDQILANLSVNARDAISNTGKIIIETGNVTFDEAYCAVHAGTVPGEFVLLTVSDNGCGMDKDVLAHIYDPFFTTKETGRGTGLGLATVYGIVKQNNGFINVYSEPGKGTTFKIYLPSFDGENDKADIAKTNAIPKGQGETVLLVEDEQSLRVTCGLLLETLGYKVLAADTPECAQNILDQHPGDIRLLLTDVVMPGMNGRQLAERLCTVKPDLNVLFMSGYTADVIDHHGILEQGVHFISKPFSRVELARKVWEILERKG
ncbi:MAG: PAS domain S-box protein [Chlorobiales bacterium]|nr:PAS domain S-box protein [Chlorobiales bacterium]